MMKAYKYIPDYRRNRVAMILPTSFKQRAMIINQSINQSTQYYPSAVSSTYKNSSGDEIANVNFLTTISHTRRPTSKYRKRDKPTSFNKLDDR